MRRIVLCAPSGTGKTTAVQLLERSFPDLTKVVSFTTRPPRPGERDGHDYRFVRPDDFRRMATNGRFLEMTRAYGSRYASGAMESDGRMIAERDLAGWLAVKRHYPDAVGIFLLPPSHSALEERLVARNSESADQRAKRLNKAHKECLGWEKLDYVIISEFARKTHEQLCRIIQGRGHPFSTKSAQHRKRIQDLLQTGWGTAPAPAAAQNPPALEMSMDA